jgi:DNA-binding winged helix-turn-helix (wHTH) protein
MSEQTGRRWQFGSCQYLELSRKLIIAGETLTPEGKLLDVLLELLKKNGEVVSRDHFLDTVWDDVVSSDESLSQAVSKLRKVLGGERESIIQTVARKGYRMAVPVTCVADSGIQVTPLVLEPGDKIPHRPHWRAVRKLSGNENSPVWLAQRDKSQEVRVYKFAVDDIRLRALKRELTIFRLLTKSLGERSSFLVRILDWNFDEGPFFLESEFCGPNLLEWSTTRVFLSTSLEQRVQVIAVLARAVASAHGVAVFHNDLKPSNILVANPMGEVAAGFEDPNADESASLPTTEWKMKIADFGAASLNNTELLRELDISDLGSFTEDSAKRSSGVGTAMYRPPELHAGGAPTAMGDTYALGVLLYQTVTGDFYAPPSPGWEQKISDPLVRKDIADAANVDPAQRIETVAELAVRLQNLEIRRIEKDRQERAELEARRTEEALARTRLLRPWVILAMASLVLGLAFSAFAAYKAVRERNAARGSNAAQRAMFDFLAIDILGQSNPYLVVAGSASAPKQTLLEAIATAVPQIDARFSNQPAVAALLHETVADSFKSRTQFQDADKEYAAAAQHFREAEGAHSQNAIVAELKRDLTEISSLQPGSIQKARKDFDQQEKLIGELRVRSAELEAWETLMKTALIGMGPHPEEALPLITAAVQRAQSTPGFDPMLLIRLKNQFCGTYVRMGDGANLERMAREIIGLLTRQKGSESPTLFIYEMYLEEAFYLQGKYPETITQANQNITRFERVLGGQHQLTLATLATRAAAEGQIEQYRDAVRDDLALNSVERQVGLDKRLEEGSLNDAATYECRGGDLRSGMLHARQVMQDTRPGSMGQPMFFNGSMFTLAECLLSEQETKPGSGNAKALEEVEGLLNGVDVRAMSETSDESAYEGARNVAAARLAILRRQFPVAQRYATTATPYLARSNADPYERRALERVKQVVNEQLRP